MIIKSTTIKSQGGIPGVVRYLFREDKGAEIVHTRYIPNGISEDEIIQLFRSQENKRLSKRKNNIVLYHDILSFHASDSHKVTLEHIREIAKRYSQMREYALSISILHTDCDHVHIHHISVGYGINHRATRVSQKRFKEKKLELETYSRKRMRLVHSNVNHQQELNLRLNSIQQEIERSGRVSEKQQIVKKLKQIIEQHPTTDAFIQELKRQGIKYYFHGGKLYGVWNEKQTKKYRFTGLGIDPYNLNPKIEKSIKRRQQLRIHPKR